MRFVVAPTQFPGILAEKHSIRILMMLHRQTTPISTHKIMEALGIRNWTTVPRTLRRLKESNLVVVEEVRSGRHKSRSFLWRLEPRYGTRVAESLEAAERWVKEAVSRPTPGRRGIMAIQTETGLVALIKQAASSG